ncbi:MAG: hypothetical protein AB7O45_00450 [Alphaproteobacteria bacterium]
MRYVGERRVVIDGKPTPTPLWEPDRSFAGATVAVIGGGPSLATLDLDVLRGHRFIVVNSGCRIVRPVATPDDPLYFSDNAWNERRPELAAAWPGPVVTCNRNAKLRNGDAVRWIDVIGLTERVGALPDIVQASSGHIAACLAAVMGAARLVLCAFEGRVVGDRTHGHGDYTQGDIASFHERFVPGWVGLAPAFARLGVEVINATPDSAVRCYPFRPLAEALEST